MKHRRNIHQNFDEAANTAASIEDAYRRGVHQALAHLVRFTADTGADINVVLPMAVKKASAIRSSSKDAEFLLDTLFGEIATELGVNHD